MSKDNRFLKNIIDKIYKVNDVQQGYFYWTSRLIDMCVDLFEYKGLPDTIPQEEIEYRLITMGFCSFVDHPYFGKIVCNSYLFNYDIYGNYKNVNFYNPVPNFLKDFNPGNKEIGKDCAVIYNDSIEKKLYQPVQSVDIFMQMICRYARQLADLESTINIEMITSRQPYIMVAQNQNTYKSFMEIFRNLKRGNISIPVDEFDLKDSKALKNKDLSPGYLNELLEARNTIIKQFMLEIGIYSTDDKKERLIVDEIATENRNSKPYIFSLLKSRKIGVESVNKLWGTNISVDLRKQIYDDSELYKGVVL